MDRATLKSMAKQQIKGNIGILFGITIIIFIVGFVLGLIPMVGGLLSTFVVTPALSIAMVHIYLNMAKGIKPAVSELWAHIGEFWGAFKVTFLTGLFVMLWTLLLIIPGYVKACAYSQALYILAENPGMGAREALKRSQEMMKGHKMEYFVLGLSFIGWTILGVFTLGILYIWLIPYMSATMVNFYNSIKPSAPVVEEA